MEVSSSAPYEGGVGGTLTVTFNAAATVAAVDALIQNLTYANVSGAPTASHELLLNVSDGEGAQPLDMARFVQLTGTANPFLGLDAPDHATPGLIDLDGDGDLDVVLGATDGRLRAFRNDGRQLLRAGRAAPIRSTASTSATIRRRPSTIWTATATSTP